MNTTIKATFGGQPIEIPADKPLTVICHPGGHAFDLDPDATLLEVTPETTLREAARLVESGEWELFRAFTFVGVAFSRVFTDFPMPVDLAKASVDMRHVIGMIRLMVRAAEEQKRPFIRLPETYLHPRHQTGLADLFMYMQSGVWVHGFSGVIRRSQP